MYVLFVCTITMYTICMYTICMYTITLYKYTTLLEGCVLYNPK